MRTTDIAKAAAEQMLLLAGLILCLVFACLLALRASRSPDQAASASIPAAGTSPAMN